MPRGVGALLASLQRGGHTHIGRDTSPGPPFPALKSIHDEAGAGDADPRRWGGRRGWRGYRRGAITGATACSVSISVPVCVSVPPSPPGAPAQGATAARMIGWYRAKGVPLSPRRHRCRRPGSQRAPRSWVMFHLPASASEH
jgi:hypothetical protein